MTAILSARNPAAPERGPIVLTLAWLEARRMLRSPWLLVAVLLTIWLWFDWASQSDWPGQRYIEMQMPVTPITTGYWLFTSPWVAPFSIVQVQPVSVDLGAGAPLGGLPDTWLLSAPNRVNGQPHWEHLVVSEPLAWWHNGWLVGLSLLVVSLAFPASWRRPLAIAGAFLASLAVVAEFVVYPS